MRRMTMLLAVLTLAGLVLHKSRRYLPLATVVASSPTTCLQPETGQPPRPTRQTDHLCSPYRPR